MSIEQGVSGDVEYFGDSLSEPLTTNDETLLFALIVDMSTKGNATVGQILNVAEAEHWTVRRTALVISYTLMVQRTGFEDEMLGVVNRSIRPMLIQQHCATCTCVDKSVKIGDY